MSASLLQGIVQHDKQWLKIPESGSVGHLHGIVTSSDGSIWIQNACDNGIDSCIWRCDRQGNILHTIQHDLLPQPHGLEIYHHPQAGECLLHTDNRTGVLLMRLDGSLVWHVGKPDFYKLHWTLAWCPSNTAISSDGRLFVADGYGSYFITTLDDHGKQLQTFAGPYDQAGGNGPGIIHPHGCAIIRWNGRDVLAVTECQLSSQDPVICQRFAAASCIRLYTLDGEAIQRLPLDTISPRHIRPFGPDHYIIPDFQARLLVTNRQFDITTRLGTKDSRFEHESCTHELPMPRPHDCCCLDETTLLVTDFTGCVHELRFAL